MRTTCQVSKGRGYILLSLTVLEGKKKSHAIVSTLLRDANGKKEAIIDERWCLRPLSPSQTTFISPARRVSALGHVLEYRNVRHPVTGRGSRSTASERGGLRTNFIPHSATLGMTRERRGSGLDHRGVDGDTRSVLNVHRPHSPISSPPPPPLSPSPFASLCVHLRLRLGGQRDAILISRLMNKISGLSDVGVETTTAPRDGGE